MAATTNIAVDNTDWVLLFTSASPDVTVGIEFVGAGNLLVHVGADPGAGDSDREGRLAVPGYHRGKNRLDLSLSDTDTVYGRMDRGSGRVTVIG
jgi:hypothetical protein